MKTYPEIEKSLNIYNSKLKELDVLFSKLDKLMKQGQTREDKNYLALSNQYEKLSKETEEYKTNELAKVIYTNLKNDKPSIKNIRTNEVFSWDQMFDKDFTVVSANKRNLLILAGLFIKTGPYRLV